MKKNQNNLRECNERLPDYISNSNPATLKSYYRNIDLPVMHRIPYFGF